jgi:MFS family permease
MSRPPLFTRAFVLGAAAVLMLNLAAFLFVHLPAFLQQLGAGEAQIGAIMATQALGAILAWPFVGRGMDLYGRRVVLLAGGALFLVVIALYLAIDALGPFVYLVRLLDGVAHSMWYTALFTYGADLVPASRRTQGLAIFGVAGLVTIGLGAQFGDLILAHAEFDELFLWALACAALGVLLCLPLREVYQRTAGPPPRNFLAAAVQPDLRPVWLAAAAFFVSLGALFTFMKTYVAAADVGSVGSFFSGYAAIAIALRLFFGWIPDRVGTRRMLGIALGLCAAGFALLATADTAAHVALAGLVAGAGHGYAYPVLFSLVVERAHARERGSAMTFYTTIDLVGLLLAGPSVGFVIESAGYAAAFAGLALVLLAGIALFYWLDRRRLAPVPDAAPGGARPQDGVSTSRRSTFSGSKQ